MTNMIRFLAFFLGLFLVTSLSAQTRGGGNTNSPAVSPSSGGNPTVGAGSYDYISFSDEVVVNVMQGPVGYSVYTRKSAESPWILVGGSESASQTAFFTLTGSYQIRVILNVPAGSSASVQFFN